MAISSAVYSSIVKPHFAQQSFIFSIAVSGDKGLAGAFNTNINKTVLRFLEAHSEQNVDVVCVGRKCRDFLRRRFPVAQADQERAGRVQLTGEHVNVLSRLSFDLASEIAEMVMDRYTRCEIDRVYLIFNEFKSVISQRLIVTELLPIAEIGSLAAAGEELSREEREKQAEAARSAGVSVQAPDTHAIDERAGQFATAQVDYIYEQPPDQLFAALLPKYVAVEVFRALMESVAAEHAARMTAMDSATTNATKMIDSLTLVMNRVRQAKITKEIIEIVSGAAASA